MEEKWSWNWFWTAGSIPGSSTVPPALSSLSWRLDMLSWFDLGTLFIVHHTSKTLRDPILEDNNITCNMQLLYNLSFCLLLYKRLVAYWSFIVSQQQFFWDASVTSSITCSVTYLWLLDEWFGFHTATCISIIWTQLLCIPISTENSKASLLFFHLYISYWCCENSRNNATDPSGHVCENYVSKFEIQLCQLYNQLAKKWNWFIFFPQEAVQFLWASWLNPACVADREISSKI